ncbi:hypothetical protein [Hydrogenophaga taeniospiralis]|uniref:hypothetical protein n=1 Tax=Hydrogenophaga taeniospiralis TaxID=65656 RepID=UPI000ADC7DE7|nr:hypothetical protein [Hydrogenophaga taeniospiralis]
MTISNVSSQRIPSQRVAIDNAPATHGEATPPRPSLDRSDGLPSRTPSSLSQVDDSANQRARVLLSHAPSAGLREDDRRSLLTGERSDSDHFSQTSIAMGRTESILASLSRQPPSTSRPQLTRELTLTDMAAQSSAQSAAITAWIPDLPRTGAQTSGTAQLPVVPPVAPQRSWRSVASAIAQSAKNLPWASVANEAALTLRSVLPQVDMQSAKRTLGAIAGHTVHQAVAVGIPTVVREMLAAGVMQALHAAPPAVAMGLQASVGVANLGLQVIREKRERRNPDEAARAYHSLSPEQWAAQPPEQQARMRDHTAKVSRAFTVSQVASSITNFALMASAFQEEGHRPGARADALRPLATEIKTGVYTAMRDAAQASFLMVGYEGDQTHGIAGAAHAAAAATYTGVLVGSSMLSDAVMPSLVPGRSQATDTLLGLPAQAGAAPMSTAQAWGTVAQAATVTAAANVLSEATDWFQRTQFHLNQNAVPPQQQWEPRIMGDDLGRVADQGVARAALVNGINSALAATGRAMTQLELPPAVQSFISNAGLAAMAALTDSPVTGIFQAQSAVRDSFRPSTATTPDVENPAPTGQSGELGRSTRSARLSQVADLPSRDPSRRFA